jgi:carbonic anhydrase
MPSKLIEGFKNFRSDAYQKGETLMKRLVQNGQDPRYFMISCIDSRGNPGTIFQAEPGTFFAHKAMGAIVRPYKQGTALAAALHFALNYNKVDTIVVLGHTLCGAVKALVNDLQDEEISSFIQQAKAGLERARAHAAKDETHDDLFRHTEEHIILLSVENLKAYPSVAKALAEKRVVIKPWLFDMESGHILEYSETSKQFETISDK